MIWKNVDYDESYLEYKSKEFGESKLITKLLLNRGITQKDEVDKFLNPESQEMYDPYLFEDMDKVVSRVIEAKISKEKIVVFGDYDVDGISGTSYLIIVLRRLGMNVDYFIPNRAHQGAKITKQFLGFLKKKNAKLVITVDTSIGSNEELEMFRDNKIDLIITDHHRQSAYNIESERIKNVNPKISKRYPNKNLSGAGVAFKLAEAIYMKLGINKRILYEYLDIVMIGTVADVVPMTDENRLIIKRGLYNLRKTKIKGLRYIINFLKLNPENITASDIGFYIAPMLNALGRIDNSKMVVDFFIEEDDFKIFNIIEEMKRANKIRRYLEIVMYNEIEEKIQKLESPKYIFMKSRKWHSGVIGVVCSRISLKYNIPVILVTIKNGYGKASCRSVDGINIFDMLQELTDKFERFGGHDLAAGFLVKEKDLFYVERNLKKKLSTTDKSEIEKKINVDSTFSIEEINKNILLNINRLSPFGMENREVNLLDEDVKFINFTKFGVNHRHFKGYIKKNERVISVIAYNLGHKLSYKNIDKSYEIVYTPTFKSGRTDLFIELKIKDFKEKN